MSAPRCEPTPHPRGRAPSARGVCAGTLAGGRPADRGRPGSEKPWIVERLGREDLSGVLPESLRALKAMREERAAERQAGWYKGEGGTRGNGRSRPGEGTR